MKHIEWHIDKGFASGSIWDVVVDGNIRGWLLLEMPKQIVKNAYIGNASTNMLKWERSTQFEGLTKEEAQKAIEVFIQLEDVCTNSM